jgi:hypothetical protein
MGMPSQPIDGQRVSQLLDLLRQRIPEEITLGVMALAPSFTPEMWHALELLRQERSGTSKQKALQAALVE